MFSRKLISSLISSKGSSSVILPSIQSIRLLSETASNTRSQRKHLIAVLQLNSQIDRDLNWRVNEGLIREAASYGCTMAFLPENFDAMPVTKEEFAASLEPIDGPMISKYRDLARSCNIWLSLGGFHEKQENNDDGRKFNTHLVINGDGDIVAIYRKIHVFDVYATGSSRIIESRVVRTADEMVPPVETPIGKLGLTICYDVRFAEFGLALAKAGADILAYPAAYTELNGAAMVEPALRFRALETQCYTVGSCQTGVHNKKRTTWGHSMIVDPMGTIIAQVGKGVGLAIALIDPELQKQARTLFPKFNDRRSDLYGQIIAPKVKENRLKG